MPKNLRMSKKNCNFARFLGISPKLPKIKENYFYYRSKKTPKEQKNIVHELNELN